MGIWTFKDIWYNRTYAYIKATVEDVGIKNKKSYKQIGRASGRERV